MKHLAEPQKVVACIKARISEFEMDYSIEVQRKKLSDYARENNLEIVKEFIYVRGDEQANQNTYFEMKNYLDDTNNCKTILVTSPDRFIRNFDVLKIMNEYTLISTQYGSLPLINQISVLMAKQYSEVCSAKIKQALKERKIQENKGDSTNAKI